MNGELLHLVRFAPKALAKKGAVPLLMEFPINPETAPFLVTSSAAMIWVMEPLAGDVVRAAVRRKTTKEALSREAFESIAMQGHDAQWGNVHPFSVEGLKAAVEHVHGYELPELEILVPQGKVPGWLEDQSLPLCPTSWLPENGAVVVPKDREYVGFLGAVGTSGLIAVIHNASRGIGILRGT